MMKPDEDDEVLCMQEKQEQKSQRSNIVLDNTVVPFCSNILSNTINQNNPVTSSIETSQVKQHLHVIHSVPRSRKNP